MLTAKNLERELSLPPNIMLVESKKDTTAAGSVVGRNFKCVECKANLCKRELPKTAMTMKVADTKLALRYC